MIDKNSSQNQIAKSLNNPVKQRIITRLRLNGRSNFGRIIKDLSLGTKDGIKHIVELKNMGVVQYVNNSSLIELNTDFLYTKDM